MGITAGDARSSPAPVQQLCLSLWMQLTPPFRSPISSGKFGENKKLAGHSSQHNLLAAALFFFFFGFPAELLRDGAVSRS